MNKTINYLLVGAIALGSFACQKKSDDDSTPSTPTTNVDLTGSYEGQITDQFGTNDLTIDIVNKSGNVYTASTGGTDVAELTVSGKNFTGTPLAAGDFKSLSGSLNGSVLTFNGIDTDNEPFSFTGTKTSGGGGGGGTDITIDGVKYTLTTTVCDASSMGAVYQEDGNQFSVAGITINFENAPAAGTYTVESTFDSPPSGTIVNATVQVQGVPTYGSAGTITVSGSAGSLSATVDGVTFDIDASNNTTAQVDVNGSVVCQ